ncbi:type VI secretion system baseplate subunit TssE [Rubrivivax gelatinosus]|uniref:Type VI secretion system protein ImpF n=1 Tax=Rubrivivax gelatinosus TaxID=28068 RepID=A0A4R2MJ45_RUBGE|nr:type VI secretion system baseplate subunit TssE [Rubrivivax gelatinosus]MBK1687554.1 hypothetical protein [Rubrivivax gelatinosus]TCP02926.1 type VI secretion system protein ImpF [Rubrivivax gelatinosus]
MRPPSLLDALLGDAGPCGAAAADDTLPQRLARDLERLLNTRCAWTPEQLAPWPRSARSVLAFGLAEGAGPGADGAEALRRVAERIRQSLAAHEPRLAEVRVAPRPGAGRMPGFRIEAALRRGAHTAGLCFEAELGAGTRHYRVRPATGPAA